MHARLPQRPSRGAEAKSLRRFIGHLGDWLLGKSEFDIEERYLEIGAAAPSSMFLSANWLW